MQFGFLRVRMKPTVGFALPVGWVLLPASTLLFSEDEGVIILIDLALGVRLKPQRRTALKGADVKWAQRGEGQG